MLQKFVLTRSVCITYGWQCHSLSRPGLSPCPPQGHPAGIIDAAAADGQQVGSVRCRQAGQVADAVGVAGHGGNGDGRGDQVTDAVACQGEVVVVEGGRSMATRKVTSREGTGSERGL